MCSAREGLRLQWSDSSKGNQCGKRDSSPPSSDTPHVVETPPSNSSTTSPLVETPPSSDTPHVVEIPPSNSSTTPPVVAALLELGCNFTPNYMGTAYIYALKTVYQGCKLEQLVYTHTRVNYTPKECILHTFFSHADIGYEQLKNVNSDINLK